MNFLSHNALTGMTDPTPPLILVVDDEPLLRLLAREFLEEMGFRVLEAPNAESALSLLEGRTDVDLLFTDVHMPGAIDGMSLARKVGARWPGVHVLMTSGRERPAPAAIPASGKFMPKPYSPDELLRHVKALIRMRDS